MLNNNHPSLEQIINYYQELITVNAKFTDIHELNDQNANYEELVKQLIIIRDLLIKRDLSNINMFYKPLEKLFNNKGHYRILETIILQFRQNPLLGYHAEESNANNEANELVNAADGDCAITNKNDPIVKLNTKLLELENNILNKLNIFENKQGCDVLVEQNNKILETTIDMQRSIEELNNHDFYSAITRATNDTMATLTTNHELMKTDINRYDAMLTDHINKSGINVTEAIEKEHARFVQKIASDSNAIIAGLIDATANILSKQTELVKASVKEIENKLFKYMSIIFIISIGFIFTCSILTSSWTANKVVAHIKAIK